MGDIQQQIPTDDVVLLENREGDLNRLNKQTQLEVKGVKISKKKTTHLKYGFGN